MKNWCLDKSVGQTESDLERDFVITTLRTDHMSKLRAVFLS